MDLITCSFLWAAWPISVPCHKNIDARGTAYLFLTHVYRAPLTIMSDQFCNLIGTKSKLSTAARPETDGDCQSIYSSTPPSVTPYVDYFQDNWSELLPVMDFATAYLPHDSTGLSPLFVECGYEPRLSIDWVQSKGPVSVKEKINREDAQKLVKRLETIWGLAKGLIQRFQVRQKKQADRHRREIDFGVRDKVWVTTKEWRTGRPSKKLDSDGRAIPDPGEGWYRLPQSSPCHCHKSAAENC